MSDNKDVAYKVYIGVDPGFKGALACFWHKGNIDVVDMPIVKATKTELDETAIVAFFEKYKPDMVVIEKSQTMPKQGISSSGRYMEGYGRIRGICAGMKIPYTLVHPKTWKKLIMFDMGKSKNESIVKVGQLFPAIDLPRKKDDGKADAILLAEYGRRMQL